MNGHHPNCNVNDVNANDITQPCNCGFENLLRQLDDVAERGLDNMEGADLKDFQKWERVHVLATELKQTLLA